MADFGAVSGLEGQPVFLVPLPVKHKPSALGAKSNEHDFPFRAEDSIAPSITRKRTHYLHKPADLLASECFCIAAVLLASPMAIANDGPYGDGSLLSTMMLLLIFGFPFSLLLLPALLILPAYAVHSIILSFGKISYADYPAQYALASKWRSWVLVTLAPWALLIFWGLMEWTRGYLAVELGDYRNGPVAGGSYCREIIAMLIYRSPFVPLLLPALLVVPVFLFRGAAARLRSGVVETDDTERKSRDRLWRNWTVATLVPWGLLALWVLYDVAMRYL